MRDPNQSLGFLMNEVARLMRLNFNRRAQSLGLSLAQWRALAYLSRQQGIRQVTLAERLEIQPITLARQIDRLEEAGLVARRPDPEDRRAFRLFLTDQAKPWLARMWALAGETHEEAMSGLDAHMRASLVQSLMRMKQNLQEVEGPAAAGERPERQAG
ncbi:MAG: MarR family transcriptional regulator [Alphaproteobacteria bacterium]|nr:MarR family transcriptional regulator [Alphaproteobacteria bacterium]